MEAQQARARPEGHCVQHPGCGPQVKDLRHSNSSTPTLLSVFGRTLPQCTSCGQLLQKLLCMHVVADKVMIEKQDLVHSAKSALKDLHHSSRQTDLDDYTGTLKYAWWMM